MTTTVRTGPELTVGSSTSLWGDIPDNRMISDVKSFQRKIIDFDNVDTTGGNWVIGFASRIRESQGVTSATHTREVVRTPDSLHPADVAQEVRFPGHGSDELTRMFDYTAGELSGVTTMGQGINARSTTASSFADGIYPQTIVDAKGYSISLAYDLRHGQPTSVIDPNGLETSVDYDEFGRPIRIGKPDGTETTILYQNCDWSWVDCSMITWAEARMRIIRRTRNIAQTGQWDQIEPSTRQYLDSNGRVVMEEVQAFAPNDDWRRTEIHRYPDGRVEKRSIPYFSGNPLASIQYAVYRYGLRGRLEKMVRPNGSAVTTTYISDLAGDRLTALIHDSATGRQKQLIFDSLGQLVETTDGYGSADAVTTTYEYGGRGLLDKVYVAGVLAADLDYDDAGNRSRIDDRHHYVRLRCARPRPAEDRCQGAEDSL